VVLVPLGCHRAHAGEHDLCLIFTAPANGPLYAVDGMRLVRQL
jgi:hypothetical protein